MISNYLEIRDNFLYISPENWSVLNRDYPKEDIKAALHDFIEARNIPMPIRQLTLTEAQADFEELMGLDIGLNAASCFTRYSYPVWPDAMSYVPMMKAGNIASDFFHVANRWRCDSINSPSPYRSWLIRKFRDGLLNSLWTLKVKLVDKQVLRTCLALRKYIASQFRPSAAKLIFNHFKAEHVLDFSAGWGDRLCGFFASNAKTYLGVDPNINLRPSYEQQQAYYEAWGAKQKGVHFIYDCAEHVSYQPESVDLVFTSPPYFNIERYTQEGNQSWKRYRKLQQWLDSFLFPALSNAWVALQRGGHMVINISDVYSLHQVNNICAPMLQYMDGLGAQFVEVMGYQMAKRPNSFSAKDGVFVEPIWIWSKP